MELSQFITPENLQIAEAFWSRFSPNIKESLRGKIKKHFVSFHQHLVSAHEKNTLVRLLCAKSIECNINDVYVKTYFSIEKSSKTLADQDLIESVKENNRVIVRGAGGSGKTFFMKKLWGDIFNHPKDRIPIFIELRRYDPLEFSDLESYIRHELSWKRKEIPKTLFNEMGFTGRFIFILDGYDEISRDNRKKVTKDILRMSTDFPKCGLIVSSRKNEDFQSWVKFSIYDVVDFTFEQTRELISKTPVNAKLKTSFLELMDEEFYNLHAEFLNTPLLTLMMLITYRDQATIPNSLTEFYENCFQALYREHDATKESFSREHFLSLTEFKRLFSTFCAFSYQQDKFEFTEDELINYLEKAKKWININSDESYRIDASASDMVHEIVESVNLMQKDGTIFTFIHRSFQEYFAANFVVSIQEGLTTKLLNIFSKRMNDKSLRLSYQLNQRKVEEHYILYNYNKLKFRERFSSDLVSGQFGYVFQHGFGFSGSYGESKDADDKPRNRVNLRSVRHDEELTNFLFSLNEILFNGQLMRGISRSVNDIHQSTRDLSKYDLTSFPPEAQFAHYSFNIGKEDYFFQRRYVGKRNKRLTEFETIKLPRIESVTKQILELNKAIEVVSHKVNERISKIVESHSKLEEDLESIFFGGDL